MLNLGQPSLTRLRSRHQREDLRGDGGVFILFQGRLTSGTYLAEPEGQLVPLLLESLHDGAHLFRQLLGACRIGIGSSGL